MITNWKDRCVFPAVEALIVLARNVQSIFPQARTDCLLKARFPRFLQVSSERRDLVGFRGGGKYRPEAVWPPG